MSDDDAPQSWFLQRKWQIFAICAILSIVADQATKVWARHSLPVFGHGSNNGECVVPEDIGTVPQMCAGKTVTLIIGLFLTYRGFTTSVPFYTQQNAAR